MDAAIIENCVHRADNAAAATGPRAQPTTAPSATPPAIQPRMNRKVCPFLGLRQTATNQRIKATVVSSEPPIDCACAACMTL